MNYLSEFRIDERVGGFACSVLDGLSGVFAKTDEICEQNFYKVLRAMQKNGLSEHHFASTSGYGYNDLGRDTLERIYADIFHTEAALVRPQIISGTHALTLALFGNLRPGDEMLSIAGAPYDTLLSVIGVHKNAGSLIENGVIYNKCDLLPDDSFDFEAIRSAISEKTRLVLIQKSKGYAFRHSFLCSEIEECIKFVKNINKDIVCMVDNCYGEFCELAEPSDVGADLTVGSLIKNIGGGLAPVGGYITGKTEYVENAAVRLTAPGLGRRVGPGLGITQSLIHGLFLAPGVVAASLKGAIFASAIYDKLGFEVNPTPLEPRADIVQAIKFGTPDSVLTFCNGIQQAAPVDSFVKPEAGDMPGYAHQVVMAAGAFVQGSSIELSADAPMREPYVAYYQGGLTWPHAKIGNMIALQRLLDGGFVSL